MLAKHAYCRRLFHLEYVQSEFETNADVAHGEYVHRYVDSGGGKISDPSDDEAFVRARSVDIGSVNLGLIGRIDIVEQQDGAVVPLEVKRGAPQRDGSAKTHHLIQVCAMALLLRDNGYKCKKAEIYYDKTRQRLDVAMTEGLITETLHEVEDLRKTASLEIAPPPLIASPKCPVCSLVSICLPDETNLHNRVSVQPPRRLTPRDSAARPMYVTEQGAKIGFQRGRVVVTKSKEKLQEARPIDVSQICLYGNAQISSQMMRAAFDSDIPVCWFSYGGWFQGIASGLPSKNIDLRRRQVAIAIHAGLPIAKAMVKGKIRNSRTFLMRNAKDDVAEEAAQLKHLANKTDDADTLESLLGIEGAAARTYFGTFSTMMRDDAIATFDMNGRNRRPPKDPVNCLLSYCYALLTKDLTATAIGVGFDPYLGVMHRPRFGRPALALDLAEEFRPLIAESVVLNLINNGEVNTKDFISRASAVALTNDARKAVLKAYERRLDSEVTHPTYRYRITYRRAMEVQARVLAAHILSEIPEYVPMLTR